MENLHPMRLYLVATHPGPPEAVPQVRVAVLGPGEGVRVAGETQGEMPRKK